MAKDFSFDIVSTVNMQEVDNALDQARREIQTRFDFKGVQADVVRDGEKVALNAQDAGRLTALVEIVKQKMIRRGVPLQNLTFGETRETPGGAAALDVELGMGLPPETAKDISKWIRELKLKVQPQIQGDLVRVSARSKDDLQTAITQLKSKDFGRAIQVVNYR